MNKKKYIICTFVDSFQFPLREALRKQVWWRAKEKQKKYNVSIVVFGKKQDSIFQDGIKIDFVDKNKINSYKLEADFIDYITTIVELRIFLAFFSKGIKTLTICDGYPLGDSKILLRKIIIKMLPLLFSKIYVFSNYQKRVLGLPKIEKINPILPKINKLNLDKYKNPTLFYMGHISYFKGIDVLLEAYQVLKNEIPNLNLIIANNMVRGDKDLIEKVETLKKEYPDSIIIKGVINPYEELSKAWIYTYPFIKPGGTMAFALSLYESQQCGTPFIACNVGSNVEFFDKKNLINPENTEEMVEKIKEILKHEYRY